MYGVFNCGFYGGFICGISDVKCLVTGQQANQFSMQIPNIFENTEYISHNKNQLIESHFWQIANYVQIIEQSFNEPLMKIFIQIIIIFPLGFVVTINHSKSLLKA